MIDRIQPGWFKKARELAARFTPPAKFQAKKQEEVCSLYLYDQIGRDPWSGEGIDPRDVVSAINEANGAKGLDVHINSPGGGVFDGLAIYNAIRSFEGTKTVHVDGMAASIASVIALAGDRVVTHDGAMWMIHEPMGGVMVFGTADEIEDAAAGTVKPLRKIRDTLIDLYVRHTKNSVADVSAWMAAETWMTAEDAKARGFTHEVEKAPEEMDPDEMEPMKEPMKKKPMHSSASDKLTPAMRREAILNRLAASRGPGPASRGDAAKATK